jgi:predicted transposase/invertase (TIGR01784 family)
VFGSPNSEPLLALLLNALLQLEGQQRIVEVVLLNPSMPRIFAGDKQAILDVRARDEAGIHYNVEVQLRAQKHYVQRSFFYGAKLYVDQLPAGLSYATLCKTIGISILDFKLFPKCPALHTHFRMTDTKQDLFLPDLFELHYLELPKLELTEPTTPFETWLYTLKHSDEFADGERVLPKFMQTEEGIIMAIESMRKAYAQDDVRNLMLAQEMYEHDVASRLEDAKLEGKLEGKLETARAFLKQGFALEQVLLVTGLSEKDLAE